MIKKEIIKWLLDGDVSVQYQTYRDLFGKEKLNLQKRISTEGWGKKILSHQRANGHWGLKFYQPKWTSTHYTLLDLKNLNIATGNIKVNQILETVLLNEKGEDGGICPIGTVKKSDVCINGMVLNYAGYFKVKDRYLESIVDFLLDQQMKDGGFNCQSNRKGALHSSLHTTLSVLEGISEYKKKGYVYRLREMQDAAKDANEFILQHKLFRSCKTGIVINPEFLKLHYPCRWHYDVLRALDYFRAAQIKYDDRMEDAIQIILDKQTKEGYWKSVKYPGQTHFDMEPAGKPSRWNTLRVLRVFQHFNIERNESI